MTTFSRKLDPSPILKSLPGGFFFLYGNWFRAFFVYLSDREGTEGPENVSEMEVIQSFTIDHTQLKPGVYVSREDALFTTFDLRITEPNKEPAVAPDAMHSIEHLMATWFRNSVVKDDVVYVGPMGCLTGMYIVMKNPGGVPMTVWRMRDLVLDCIEWILTQDAVPATTPEACGNYKLHNLADAKWELSRYAERLRNDFHCEYTKLKVELDNGMQFADA